ncbi:hypothetical protein D3C81_2020480 [compost metagenome]
MQETIGRNQFYAAMLWPAAEQGLQYTCCCTFAYRDAAGNTNDIRDAWGIGTKELLENSLTTQTRANVEV